MFYIEVTESSDIDVTAGSGRQQEDARQTVIEDDDPQSVTVKRETRTDRRRSTRVDGEIEFNRGGQIRPGTSSPFKSIWTPARSGRGHGEGGQDLGRHQTPGVERGRRRGG